MNPSLPLSDVEPLLARPLTATERPRSEAFVAAMMALLVGRYGDSLTARWEAVQPLVVAYVAASIDRRLAKANQAAESETSGPFSVRWSSASSSGAWFLPAELADLDRLFGKGGSRTYRTQAPDAQWVPGRFTRRDVPLGLSVGGIEYGADWSVDDV